MLMGARSVRVAGGHLAPADVALVARDGAPIEIASQVRVAVAASARALAAHVAAGAAVYGATTGVGGLESHRVADPMRLQRNLIRSHAAGTGPPMTDEQVRAMMLVRLNALCGGMSGVSLELIDCLAAMLEAGVTPVVPAIGSVGAADLAPLAHVGLVLLGEGRACFRGVELPGGEAMAAAAIGLPALGGRDGLALLGGLAQTAGIAALLAADAERLILWSEAAAALTLAATGAPTSFLSELAVASKPHPGAVASAAALRRWAGDESRALRAPMSIRAAAHVAGNARELTADLERVVAREIAAPADNPMVAADGRLCCNAPGFDGHRIASAIDATSGALVTLAAASERRIAQLVDPRGGGLPAYLIHPAADPGASSGLMIAHYTAAALVAELTTGWRPVAGASLPVANGSEDLVSMASIAARRGAWVCDLAERAVAIELLAAAQAIDVGDRVLPRSLAPIHAEIRGAVAVRIEDRAVAPDIEAALGVLRAAPPPE
jgi:histidine ammonia-lyase